MFNGLANILDDQIIIRVQNIGYRRQPREKKIFGKRLNHWKVWRISNPKSFGLKCNHLSEGGLANTNVGYPKSLRCQILF